MLGTGDFGRKQAGSVEDREDFHSTGAKAVYNPVRAQNHLPDLIVPNLGNYTARPREVTQPLHALEDAVYDLSCPLISCEGGSV